MKAATISPMEMKVAVENPRSTRGRNGKRDQEISVSISNSSVVEGHDRGLWSCAAGAGSAPTSRHAKTHPNDRVAPLWCCFLAWFLPRWQSGAFMVLLSGLGSFSSSTSLLRSFFLSQTLWPFGSYGFSRFTQILTAPKSLAARIISSDSLSVEAKL